MSVLMITRTREGSDSLLPHPTLSLLERAGCLGYCRWATVTQKFHRRSSFANFPSFMLANYYDSEVYTLGMTKIDAASH